MQGLTAFGLGAATVWFILCVGKYRRASAAEASSAYRQYKSSAGFMLSLAALLLALRIPAACPFLGKAWRPLSEGYVLVALSCLPISMLAIYGIVTRRPVMVAGMPTMIALFPKVVAFALTFNGTVTTEAQVWPFLVQMLAIAVPAGVWLVVSVMERSFWAAVSDSIVPPPARTLFRHSCWRYGSQQPLTAPLLYAHAFGGRQFTPSPQVVDLEERGDEQQPALSYASVAWLDSAFAAIPLQHRDRALAAFAAALDARYRDALGNARARRLRATKDTAWMRKVFSLTPRANRRALDRKISGLLHPDAGGSEPLFIAWKDAARRFPASELETE